MTHRWNKQQRTQELPQTRTPTQTSIPTLHQAGKGSKHWKEDQHKQIPKTDTHMIGMVSVTYNGIVVNPIYSTTSNSNPEVTPYGSSISGHEDSGLAARIRHLGMLNSPTQPRSIWAVSAYKTKIITNTHFSTSKVGYGDVSINNTAKHH